MGCADQNPKTHSKARVLIWLSSFRQMQLVGFMAAPKNMLPKPCSRLIVEISFCMDLFRGLAMYVSKIVVDYWPNTISANKRNYVI